MKYVTNSTAETWSIGELLARDLRPGDALLVSGDLGTGKTTLLQGVVSGLGGKVVVTSPSFTLLHEYPLPRGRVFRHFDLYRLQSPAVDAERLGFQELLADEQAIAAVEWADRLPILSLRGQRTFCIVCRHGENPSRRVIDISVRSGANEVPSKP